MRKLVCGLLRPPNVFGLSCVHPYCVEVIEIVIWVCCYPSCVEVIVVEFWLSALSLLCEVIVVVSYLLCRGCVVREGSYVLLVYICQILIGGSLCWKSCVDV